MRFHCGHKFNETFDEKTLRLCQWRLRFAWLPVRINMYHCAWLEFVERRTVYGYKGWRHEYRLFEPLKGRS